jgi:hypothetical protein
MPFWQNLLLNGLVTRYADSILAPTYALLIYSKLGTLSLFHHLADLSDLRATLCSHANAIL